MQDGSLAMPYHSTDDSLSNEGLSNDSLDDEDIWSRVDMIDDNLGPGPPPPEFLIPPPPLPDFMLPSVDGECIQKPLPEHFASCDNSYSTYNPTSTGQIPGIFGGGDEPGSSHIHLIYVALGLGAIFILAVCVAVFIAWRRCRSRNRLAYLRKTSGNFETTAETSEHPLIYEDSNFLTSAGIRAHPRLPVAHVNSYQLENTHRNHFQNERLTQSTSYPFDASTGTRSICRSNPRQVQEMNDNERIYEELFLNEEPVYSHAQQGALPHLSDHYYQPPLSGRGQSVSRSSTLSSIKKFLGFSEDHSMKDTSPSLPPLNYVPAPHQFVSHGALSQDSLMMMSPDYSVVYHPLSIHHRDPQSMHHKRRDNFQTDNCPNDILSTQLRGSTKMSSNMAESSFSSSSCSSGSTRPPSHNNSTTSTIPVACLSSSSCSCTSSTCQYQRTGIASQIQNNEHQNVYSYPDPPVRNHLNPDLLAGNNPHGYPVHYDPGLAWPQVVTPRRAESGNKNNKSFLSSLWRKGRSKTSSRTDRRRKLPPSNTTIFRVEPTHPACPRMYPNAYHIAQPCQLQNADNNGNQPFSNAPIPPLPISLSVHHAPNSMMAHPNQRYLFAQANAQNNLTKHNQLIAQQQRQVDLPVRGPNYSGYMHGTPTMHQRRANHLDHQNSHFHGTISNRRKKPKKKENGPHCESDNENEDPSVRLPLLPGDELWRPMPGSTTLGKSPRGPSNSGVMPNPDDILPKQAWVDVSGTNDWPSFEQDHKQDARQRPNSNGTDETQSNSSQEVYENCEPLKSVPVPKERRFVPKTANIEKDRYANIEPDLNGLDEGLVDDDDDDILPDSDDESRNNRDKSEGDSLKKTHGDNDLLTNCDDNSLTTVPSRTYRSSTFINLSNPASPSKHSMGSPVKKGLKIDR